MSFVYPQFFWGMMIPFVVFAFLVVTNKDRVSRVFDEKVLKRLRADSEALPNSLRNLVLFGAAFLMIVALARPVIDKGQKRIPLKGLDILMALDISGSMRSKDLYPNRLGFAKIKMKQLLDEMNGDEIAVAAFAHSAFVLSPFTGDTATLKEILDGVSDSYITLASTDFSALAELAGKMLEKKNPKILVVFSDGGDARALRGLAEELKSRHIILYAVLVGTRKGAPVLDDRGRPLRTRNGNIAITQLNEELGQVARQSGGEYLIAANGREDMRRLAERIHAQFARQRHGSVVVRERVELFVYPLAAALLLLLIGLSSMPRSGERFRVRRFGKKSPSPGGKR